ncbi:DUF547 domain-containing protein [Fulvivirga ulvae]|uniref:DUF547 domain-containing protein n=1 Tax=Fulvivirga ulvae TaxID=2904245 RepID=UPI001F214484|nr:DUF547 domain-containing protein [Fulvivirga ulvae]UII32093.1 DUF547 domain-containing protein [Fulvivirga ulvae]
MRWLFLILLLADCTGASRQTVPRPPSHDIWDKLLQKHVDKAGWVDYKGFEEDSEILEQYLELLGSNAPDKKLWSEDEQLVYWINAYNAFTVKLIVDHYPLKSIRDLDPLLSIPTLNTVWHRKFFKIGGRKTSLDEIEHEILRKQFEEPRIHFAINCASYSCPPLRAEAYRADNINNQLNEQATLFINDPLRNHIKENQVALSAIFDWFQEDFTQDGSVIKYVNQYSHTPISESADVEYLPYSWQLNEK